ncbi:MAG: hypothetical protein IPM13_08815 [Phycisphaerales bacterium]|nr:hypothetical protein [Phycisphaerales bacterium]
MSDPHDIAARPALPARRDARLTFALAATVGSIAVYCLALCILAPEPLGDEATHLHVIRSLLRGDWAPAARLPMLPTYHLVVAPLVYLGGESLAAARVANAIIATIMLGLAALCVRRLQPDCPAAALLHVAWCPLVFPLTAINHTDALSLCFLIGVLAAHVRGLRLAAGATLLVATLVRQTNAVWALFFIAWDVLEAAHRAPAGERTPRGIASHGARACRLSWPYFVAPAMLLSAVLVFGRYSVGGDALNGPAFNVAQFYLLAIHVTAWGLPLWLPRLWEAIRTRWSPALSRPWRAALVVAFAGLMVVGFRNPHAWNREFWDLRNAPLLLMQTSLGARIALAVVLAAVLPVIVRFYAEQPRRGVLLAAWIAALVGLAPQFLAEPRYYAFALVLVNLLTVHGACDSRRLAAWYAASSIALACVACLTGRQYGGVW